MNTALFRQRTLAALGALVLSVATFSAFAFSDDQGKTVARLAQGMVDTSPVAAEWNVAS